MKRIIFFVLLILSLLCLQAEALTNPEYEADKRPTASASCPGIGEIQDSWSFYTCNCTSYAAWRLNELWKSIAPSSSVRFWNQYRATDPNFIAERWSNARYWGYRAQELGITVNMTPKSGAVGWIDADSQHPVGHVFFVEDVIDSQVKISEYNFDGNLTYREIWVGPSYASGYIHFTPSHLEYLKELLGEGDLAYWEVVNYQTECQLTGLCETGGEGSSFSTLPDFYVKKFWLETPGGTEKYTYSLGDTIITKARFKNIGEGSCSGDITGHFYLSNGYDEDPHSGDGHWRRINASTTHCSNLEPGETHTETETTIISEWITEPGVYNIVACIDHPQDDHNNGGDYAEEHESNNCSTEAVFTVNGYSWLAPIINYILQ